MFKFVKDVLTGKDGETHDIGRWSWVCSSIAVSAAAAMNWFHGAAIDLVQLGTALTGLAAGHGFAIKVKKETEPDGPN